MRIVILVVLFFRVFRCCSFTNPVSPHGADPWVIQHTNSTGTENYYYSYTLNGKEFTISRTQRLEEIGRAEVIYHFQPPEGTSYSSNVWAPELHYFPSYGAWYVYFAAGTGPIPTQRMHVLKGRDSPEKGFSEVIKLNLPDDQYSIDGTVINIDGNLYFVWSGWPDEHHQIQNLYISEMENPYTIKTSSSRVLISQPTFSWETSNGRINEGPEQLNSVDGKTTFIIYSATGSMSNNYCLGQLELINRSNPMELKSWEKKDSPVFQKTKNVWGPGHSSFTKSSSKKQDWIVYHSARCDGCGWDREVNIQEFKFDEEGKYPMFDVPISPHVNTSCPV